MRPKTFIIGDLVTVYTGGWEARLKRQYKNKAGIITHIANPDKTGTYSPHLRYQVNFGWGDIEVAESRLRHLTQEKE